MALGAAEAPSAARPRLTAVITARRMNPSGPAAPRGRPDAPAGSGALWGKSSTRADCRRPQRTAGDEGARQADDERSSLAGSALLSARPASPLCTPPGPECRPLIVWVASSEIVVLERSPRVRDGQHALLDRDVGRTDHRIGVPVAATAASMVPASRSSDASSGLLRLLHHRIATGQHVDGRSGSDVAYGEPRPASVWEVSLSKSVAVGSPFSSDGPLRCSCRRDPARDPSGHGRIGVVVGVAARWPPNRSRRRASAGRPRARLEVIQGALAVDPDVDRQLGYAMQRRQLSLLSGLGGQRRVRTGPER